MADSPSADPAAAESLLLKLKASRAFSVYEADGVWWLAIELAPTNAGRARVEVTEAEAHYFGEL